MQFQEDFFPKKSMDTFWGIDRHFSVSRFYSIGIFTIFFDLHGHRKSQMLFRHLQWIWEKQIGVQHTYHSPTRQLHSPTRQLHSPTPQLANSTPPLPNSPTLLPHSPTCHVICHKKTQKWAIDGKDFNLWGVGLLANSPTPLPNPTPQLDSPTPPLPHSPKEWIK